MGCMSTVKAFFKNRRRYSLAEFPGWLVVIATMGSAALAWFWSKKTMEFGEIFITEFDRYGPFYWKALACFAALFCIGFLALIWASVATHLWKNLQERLFTNP